MAVQLSVGPAVLTLNQGSTFMVTDLNGEIAADSEQGVFAGDTRFVSYYAVSANGVPWQRLASSTTTYYDGRIYLTNPAFATEAGTVAWLLVWSGSGLVAGAVVEALAARAGDQADD